jgi:hypothetical protein
MKKRRPGAGGISNTFFTGLQHGHRVLVSLEIGQKSSAVNLRMAALFLRPSLLRQLNM